MGAGRLSLCPCVVGGIVVTLRFSLAASGLNPEPGRPFFVVGWGTGVGSESTHEGRRGIAPPVVHRAPVCGPLIIRHRILPGVHGETAINFKPTLPARTTLLAGPHIGDVYALPPAYLCFRSRHLPSPSFPSRFVATDIYARRPAGARPLRKSPPASHLPPKAAGFT